LQECLPKNRGSQSSFRASEIPTFPARAHCHQDPREPLAATVKDTSLAFFNGLDFIHGLAIADAQFNRLRRRGVRESSTAAGTYFFIFPNLMAEELLDPFLP